MRDLLHQILRESELKIQTFQDQVSRFEKDPMILVQEMFVNQDLLLPILIQRYGDESLLEIQAYWYRHFLPEFKHYLGVEEISLSFDEAIYPAPIKIHLGEEIIALVDIVNHQFERMELALVLDAKARIEQIKQKLKEVEEELQKKEPALKNPLVLGGANPVKLLDISIRQKKYKKEIRQDVHSLQEYFFELDKERLRLESSIEQLQRVNVGREYILDRVEKRIRQLPGFSGTQHVDFDNLEEIEGVERGFSL